MRDVLAELKALRLYGMADAWAELVSTSELGCQSSGWLKIAMLLLRALQKG